MQLPNAPQAGSVLRHDGKRWTVTSLIYKLLRPLTWVGNFTAPRTWTIPDRSDTVAGLKAQTFSELQTFAGSAPSYPGAGYLAIGGGGIYGTARATLEAANNDGLTTTAAIADMASGSLTGYFKNVSNNVNAVLGGVRLAAFNGEGAIAVTYDGSQIASMVFGLTNGSAAIVERMRLTPAGDLQLRGNAFVGNTTDVTLSVLNTWYNLYTAAFSGLLVLRDRTNGGIGIYAVDFGLGTVTTIAALADVAVQATGSAAQVRFTAGAARSVRFTLLACDNS